MTRPLDAIPPGPFADQLPPHARERIAEMRARKLFTSDLSVNELLLVKEAGFEPLGLVMGSSIHGIDPRLPQLSADQLGCELEGATRALHHARELAMSRMEEEAHELGADGIVAVRLQVNLAMQPQRREWEQFRIWQSWSKRAGFRRVVPPAHPSGWVENWIEVAWSQWTFYCAQLGWQTVPQPPWLRPPNRAVYGLAQNAVELVAIGTAVRHRDGRGQSWRSRHGRPFQSALGGQDFWMLIRSGYRPSISATWSASSSSSPQGSARGSPSTPESSPRERPSSRWRSPWTPTSSSCAGTPDASSPSTGRSFAASP